MLKLVIEDGDGTTHVVPIIRDQITIGREEGNTIRLTERNVSRHHTRLTRSGSDSESTIILEDLDSYNGVRVNGLQVVRKQTLIPEDTMQIGDYFIAIESDVKTKPVASLIDTTITEMESTEELNPSLDKDKQGRLVVVSSNLAGTSYWLSRRQMLVGRSDAEGNDLVVKHRSISRHHAKFIYRDGAYTLVDLASSNGVLVNGAEAGTTSLVNGDIIEMGHVKLRYCAPGDTYSFQMTDIDDVVVVSTGQSLRLFLTIIVLLAIGSGGYVLTNGSAPDSSKNKARVAASVAETPTTPQNKGGNTAALGDIEQENDKDAFDTANANSQVDMLEMSADQRSLFDEAARWSEKQEWSTASRVYDRIIEDADVNAQVQAEAQNLKRTVDEETENLKRLERIKEIEVTANKEEMLTAVLPTENSVYFATAQTRLTQIRAAKVAALIEQFDTNLSEKAWTLAEQDLSDMKRFGVDADERLSYETRLTNLRQESTLKRKKKRKTTKAKAKKSSKERKKSSQRPAKKTPKKTGDDRGGSVKLSQQTALFSILEDAYRTNPDGRKNILKKLCDLSDAKGKVSKAIKYCSEHLPNETNKMLRNALERKIERWKKRAQ